MLFLLTPLLAWNITHWIAPTTLIGVVFLLGPFLGLGALAYLLTNVTDTVDTTVFAILVNAIVLTALLGGIAYHASSLPLTRWTLVVGFDVLYLACIVALWRVSPSRLGRLSISRVPPRVLAFGVMCLLVLLAAAFSFEVKATTGNLLPVIILYGWALLTFVVLFVRVVDDVRIHVIFLATVGILMLWSQSLTSNGLYAVDGLSTVRFVRSVVFGIPTEIHSSRVHLNLTATGFLPALTLLTDWSPYAIAKYVVPAVAGISLVGVYRLSREWLDARSALAATFFLSYHYPFLVGLPLNYRSSIAFPVLIAVYLSLKLDGRAGSRAATIVYLGAVLLLHDTVGGFLLGTLGIATALVLLACWSPWTSIDPGRTSSLILVSLAGGLLFFLFFASTATFDSFATRGVFLVIGVVLGGLPGASSRRGLDSTIGGLSQSLVEVVQQGSIITEIGLMALGTALVIGTWLLRERIGDVLPWHTGDTFHEILLVANAAWFGLLVVLPILGLPRVYLYASPLLVGVFVFVIRQVDGVVGLVERGTEWSDWTGSNGRSVAAILLVVLVVFGFVTQTGLLTVAYGGFVSHSSLGDTDSVQLRYYSPEDVGANRWINDHHSPEERLHVDRFGHSLLVDDPQVNYSTLRRILVDDRLHALLETGCVFFRTNNVESGQFLARVGPGAAREVPWPSDVPNRYATVYTGGSTRYVCEA